MKRLWPLSSLLLFVFLASCAKSPDARGTAVDQATTALKAFLDPAMHEFEKEMGSTSKNRWEAPHVTRELFLLTEMEYSRTRAFADGLRSDRKDPPQVKIPTPRSFWIPIAAEGSNTYEVESATSTDTGVVVHVRFHCLVGTQTYSDQRADYHMVREAGGWKLDEISDPEEYSLRKYLLRHDY